MEKLIELLNEYEQLNMCRKFDCFEMHTFENSGWVDRLLEDTVISARYGFIKWLVENDKIDTDAYKTVYSGDLDKRRTLTMSSGWDEFYQVTEHWVYESLIMLLSISDTPIEDLLLYLK